MAYLSEERSQTGGKSPKNQKYCCIKIKIQVYLIITLSFGSIEKKCVISETVL